MEFRDTPAPSYFNDPHAPQFVSNFNESYGSIEEYNITDPKRREFMDNKTRVINDEYAEMVSTYRVFFDNERDELDAYIKMLDDSDIRQKGI